ncbi:hypothetical protein VTO42DRAFT_5294 [Malbranchea cinnamomea]
MKAIRRSLKGEKEPKPHHISITPKSAIAILPPKKVIKALYDYQPEPGNTQELAFSKGDFFHVISREDDTEWYEACNPLFPNARGLVPVSFFEVIGKNRNSGGSGGAVEDNRKEAHDSGFSDHSVHMRTNSTSTTKPGTRSRMSSGAKAAAMVYGVVLYDFHAERPDELEAKAGEAIIVIAQSNPEWFVAKPIGRLGGPGLIPVTFVEIRDMTTGQPVADPLEAVKRAGVPRVEEWKKMTAEYKNSSISLGKLDGGSGVQSATTDLQKMTLNNTGQPNGNDYYHQRNSSRTAGHQDNQARNRQSPPQPQPQSQQQGGYYPVLAPIRASIPRYCFDNDKYWYIIEAQMEDGRWWELSRYYHDFYDFQIALLQQFEEEAGNKGKPRTLPFMPGPVTHVTDAISNGRRQNLDEYIKKLLAMPPHISRCQLVKQLFAPRPGDYEIEDPTLNHDNDEYRPSSGSRNSSGQDASHTASRQSSQGHMNNGYQPGSMRPPSSQMNQHHNQGSISQPQTGGAPSRAELQQQMMTRQASSMTQTSTTSTTGAIKIKVFFQNEIIAIRVPNDITFQQLMDKLRDRLKIDDEILVRYKDEPSGNYVELMSDNDLANAIRRNAKLALYVGIA